jgi:hypothetical protein
MGHEASTFMITLFCLISSVQEREGKEIWAETFSKNWQLQRLCICDHHAKWFWNCIAA